ncbi:hypothetical protein [Sediminibacterium ginsengisoli]|uniref:Uncharacterized protein n=1 Tax=Sediminibacterium ginsengisoli TaxID=413434 RepID=A0A1T4PUT4_9BACT|nr:hypothetical protein [Sediminibacterium ginsengisoli]SJZ94698.1 hypothetical protein SAMN04488132_106205 [Sediminibacterium ginsengisoli]SKA20880.1 hypothetical protein SAMN04488132_11639 [Sediminibacterium ginsengisoli]
MTNHPYSIATIGVTGSGFMHFLSQVPGVISALGQIAVAIIAVTPAIKHILNKNKKKDEI